MEQISEKDINDMNVVLANEIAFNILNARIKSGLSQIDLACLTNTSQSVILYAERGRNKLGKPFIPTVLTIKKISVALKINLTELIPM